MRPGSTADSSRKLNLQTETAQSLMREAVIEAYTEMRHDLACSEVLRLPAGSAHVQQSHLVLLKGTLKTAILRSSDSDSGNFTPLSVTQHLQTRPQHT